MIVYEYPLNERIRTYLRLEKLFLRLQTLIARNEVLDHHFALLTLFEMLEVGGRTDLRSDLIKDMERQTSALQLYLDNPVINRSVLDQVLAELEHCHAVLSAQQGKVYQALTAHEWLSAVRNRINVPGGTCEFDLPAYYAWQNRMASLRRDDLLRWSGPFNALCMAIQLFLKLLRQSGSGQKFIANAGLFQHNLPAGRHFLLLRLSFDESCNLIPEISANRLMVSLRLLESSQQQRAQPTVQDVPFELMLCH